MGETPIGFGVEEQIKRWTARRKSALVLKITHGKTTIVEARRQFDLLPSENVGWAADGKRGMENFLNGRAKDALEQ